MPGFLQHFASAAAARRFAVIELAFGKHPFLRLRKRTTAIARRFPSGRAEQYPLPPKQAARAVHGVPPMSVMSIVLRRRLYRGCDGKIEIDACCLMGCLKPAAPALLNKGLAGADYAESTTLSQNSKCSGATTIIRRPHARTSELIALADADVAGEDGRPSCVCIEHDIEKKQPHAGHQNRCHRHNRSGLAGFEAGLITARSVLVRQFFDV